MKLIDLIKPFSYTLTHFKLSIDGENTCLNALYVEDYFNGDTVEYDEGDGKVEKRKLADLPDYFFLSIIGCYTECVGLKAFIRVKLYRSET